MENEINKSLEAIAPDCAWTKGTWAEINLKWNEVQNVSSHIRTLSDYLVRLDIENIHRKII